MRRTLSDPWMKEESFIPRIPFNPVPRRRLRNRVSALSLALCATATALKPSFSHRDANQPYRSSRAAISMLTPFVFEYSSVSKSAFMKGRPWLSAHPRTNDSSPSLSEPRRWKLQWATARSKRTDELRNRSPITMESIPPLTASRTAPPSGSSPSRQLSKRACMILESISCWRRCR